ncbi:MAG: DUF2141 domain-containing protein [Eudoraea sp.]|uniref:DUF2141 domain-containing protein n=1 Tax=Eudoraea sp. TaxID=1979955 RepID=UPI003267BB36
MKTLALILGLFITGIVANAQDIKGITVKVTIENVLSDEGQILAALHTQDTFMRGLGIQNFQSKAKTGSISFVFEDVKPGAYAISSLHDANENQRMDFEDSGMPKENYAMSGNEMNQGPPTFQDVKFEVNGEDLELNLRF